MIKAAGVDFPRSIERWNAPDVIASIDGKSQGTDPVAAALRALVMPDFTTLLSEIEEDKGHEISGTPRYIRIEREGAPAAGSSVEGMPAEKRTKSI